MLTDSDGDPKLLIDALPYIDAEYENPQMKDRVTALVQEEMRNFTPSDYLSHLPAPKTSYPTGSLLSMHKNELLSGNANIPLLDTSRKSIDPPPQALQHDLHAWKQANSRAKAELEHQLTRITNLELASKYVATAHRIRNQTLGELKVVIEAKVEEQNKIVDEINKKRKLDQVSCQDELFRAKKTWWELINKNQQIETACAAYENEIRKMKVAKTAK